jgi:S-adenosylmethionine hydrolase
MKRLEKAMGNNIQPGDIFDFEIEKTKLVNASYLLNTRLSYFTDMDVFMQVPQISYF